MCRHRFALHVAGFVTLVGCYGDNRTSMDTTRAAAAPETVTKAAIAADSPGVDTTTARPELAGTSWRLVQIESMADSTFTPPDRSLYTVTFGTDGRASLRVDCNRGSAPWTSTGQGDLTFGPPAMTKVMCPPGSLYNRVVRDLPYVRTYILRGGRLHLSTYADGAIYEFESQPANRD